MATKDTPKVSANAAAVLIGDRVGREVSPKQVRSMAREHLPAYMGDDGYTRHAYDREDVLALLDLFATRQSRTRVPSGPDGKPSAKAVADVLGLDAPSAKGDSK